VGRRPYGQTKLLQAACVHDGNIWALRLPWAGVSPAGLDFPDSLAIARPMKAESVLVMMGSPEAPIHYLRWRANKMGLQSQLASGIGKSTEGPKTKAVVQAVADGTHWNVVISRALAIGPELGSRLRPLIERAIGAVAQRSITPRLPK
jgi:DMSO reductase family type II enzyme heme b subunit